MNEKSPNTSQTPVLDQLCINTIRFLSIDAVQKANSGHPGMPMGAAPMAYVLWMRYLKHNPANPAWWNRDRFLLSAGHGSMLLYSLLHLTGYDLPLSQLQQFRQWGSRTPGHPERGFTPGVETTTGPLGQGFANGVGMAIAEAHLAARFNRPGHEIVNHHTYALVGDGDLMEGISAEAASLAGHLKLGKLIYLYDDNRICLAGSTDISFSEDRAKRFESYGWHTVIVEDGNNIDLIDRAIAEAQAETARPSLILVRTHIGFGSPHKQDSFESHGSPLGADEVKATKQNLGWPLDPTFYVPEEALAGFRRAQDIGSKAESDWSAMLSEYSRQYPELAQELQRIVKGELPADWAAAIPSFPADAKGMATRAASGKIINAVGTRISNLIGGSADLNPSTQTVIKGAGDFQNPASDSQNIQGKSGGAWAYDGRNVHFGVREHAMGSIANGMAAHGGIIPYASTFFVFSDYMRPPMRLASLMDLGVIYIYTHDSIGVGEDGPTHQPIEQLAALRAIPGLIAIRPCDANETAVAWSLAIENRNKPVALVLTRQDLPILDRTQYGSPEGVRQGAYVLADTPGRKPELVLIGTGSEVALIVAAQKELAQKGVAVRTVSMPSWELFEAQPQDYKNQVLPPDIPARLAVEAGISQGWCRYIGDKGATITIDHFGASAPAKVIFEKFGFTVDNVVSKALQVLESSRK